MGKRRKQKRNNATKNKNEVKAKEPEGGDSAAELSGEEEISPPPIPPSQDSDSEDAGAAQENSSSEEELPTDAAEPASEQDRSGGESSGEGAQDRKKSKKAKKSKKKSKKSKKSKKKGKKGEEEGERPDDLNGQGPDSGDGVDQGEVSKSVGTSGENGKAEHEEEDKVRRADETPGEGAETSSSSAEGNVDSDDSDSGEKKAKVPRLLAEDGPAFVKKDSVMSRLHFFETLSSSPPGSSANLQSQPNLPVSPRSSASAVSPRSNASNATDNVPAARIRTVTELKKDESSDSDEDISYLPAKSILAAFLQKEQEFKAEAERNAAARRAGGRVFTRNTSDISALRRSESDTQIAAKVVAELTAGIPEEESDDGHSTEGKGAGDYSDGGAAGSGNDSPREETATAEPPKPSEPKKPRKIARSQTESSFLRKARRRSKNYKDVEIQRVDDKADDEIRPVLTKKESKRLKKEEKKEAKRRAREIQISRLDSGDDEPPANGKIKKEKLPKKKKPKKGDFVIERVDDVLPAANSPPEKISGKSDETIASGRGDDSGDSDDGTTSQQVAGPSVVRKSSSAELLTPSAPAGGPPKKGGKKGGRKKKGTAALKDETDGSDNEEKKSKHQRSKSLGSTSRTTANIVVSQDDSIAPHTSPRQRRGRYATLGASAGEAAKTEISPRSPLRKYNDKTPRLQVLRELIETEKDYIRDLEVINRVFITPIQQEKILTAAELTSVFSNATMLWKIHSELLKKFNAEEGESIEDLMFGEIFVRLAPFLKIYTQYCTANETQNIIVEGLRKENDSFRQYLEEQKSNPDCRQLDLEAFLIKPVQRICKYPLLFRELLKYTPEDHPDLPNLQQVQTKVNEIVKEINERRHLYENSQKIQQLRDSIEAWECEQFEIVIPSRTYHREGSVGLVTSKNGKHTPGQLFLFNDCLIFLKSKKMATLRGRVGWTVAGKVDLRAPRSVVLGETKLIASVPKEAEGLRRPRVNVAVNKARTGTREDMLDVRSIHEGERFRFLFHENTETKTQKAFESLQSKSDKKKDAQVKVRQVRDDWLAAIDKVIVEQWGEQGEDEDSSDEETMTFDVTEDDELHRAEKPAVPAVPPKIASTEDLNSFRGQREAKRRNRKSIRLAKKTEAKKQDT